MAPTEMEEQLVVSPMRRATGSPALRRLRNLVGRTNASGTDEHVQADGTSQPGSTNEPPTRSEQAEEWSGGSPIKIKTEEYKKGANGSITLSVELDKDQIECPICYQAMTGAVFRCRAPGNVSHNICGNCEWQIRRTKTGNGHTKAPHCPLCKVEGAFIRNRSLERHLRSISKECEHCHYGCQYRSFPWDKDSRTDHMEECTYSQVECPVCNEVFAGGRQALVAHLLGNRDDDAEKETEEDDEAREQGRTLCRAGWKRLKLMDDHNHHLVFTLGQENAYYVNRDGGYVVMFEFMPEQKCWKSWSYSMVSESGERGNNVVYVQYQDSEEYMTYHDSEQNLGPLSQFSNAPTLHTVQVKTHRPRSGQEASKEKQPRPKSQYMFLGPNLEANQALRVRIFTLEETTKLGSIIDARDFTGKWYEAEVIRMSRHNMSENSLPENNLNAHTGRRFKVHYLGYSANYDEWLDLDMDSHRVAQRGTYTTGPNLRTIRRQMQNQSHGMSAE